MSCTVSLDHASYRLNTRVLDTLITPLRRDLGGIISREHEDSAGHYVPADREAWGTSYTLGRTLGTGSYGTVFEAHSLEEERPPCAIKITRRLDA